MSVLQFAINYVPGPGNKETLRSLLERLEYEANHPSTEEKFTTIILAETERQAMYDVLYQVLRHQYDHNAGMPEEAYYGMHALKRGRSLLLPMDDEVNAEE